MNSTRPSQAFRSERIQPTGTERIRVLLAICPDKLSKTTFLNERRSHFKGKWPDKLTWPDKLERIQPSAF